VEDLVVQKFRGVWAGCRKDAYGTFSLDGTRKGPKVGGRAVTIREPLTDTLFAGHLDGSAPIGLVPISPPDKCQWGVIDVDDYSFDHEKFRNAVARYRLPVIHCRSKSGGAHLYFFLDAPIEARDLRNELERIAAELGYRGSEIFPKQPNVQEGEVGNWINLPYADSERTVRYAISHETGESIDLEDFIDLVESRRLTLAQLQEVRAVNEEIEEEDDLFMGGPPCLPAIASNGVPEGTRNAVLYNVGMYLKKRFPKEWAEKISEYNQKIMQEPLGAKEVHTLARSCAKGSNFTCKSEPLKSHCQSKVCATRKFGVGEGGEFEFPAIQSLQKVSTEPPTYFMRVEGHEEIRLELRSGDLMSFRAFRQRVFEQLNWYPPSLSPKMFDEIMRDATEKMQEIPMEAEESLYAGAKGATLPASQGLPDRPEPV